MKTAVVVVALGAAALVAAAAVRGELSIPNPNVTFELGLAVAHLGWDRIILLFNEKVAIFDKLPFDFDRHRISKFKMTEKKKPAVIEQKNLIDLVILAVETILDQKPLRPRELEGKPRPRSSTSATS